MYYDFQKDILTGEESEKKFANLLLTKCRQIKNVSFNKDKRYDVLVEFNNGTQTTFEIKHDLLTGRTGNIAIETFSRGKLSGINVTQADYFVIHCFTDKEHFYVFNTSFLKKSVEMNMNNEIYGGDKDAYGNYTTKFVLLRLKDELNIAVDLTELEDLKFYA